MSVERDKMIKALKKIVVPILREKGFKGSFPHFRRITTERINLLTFQFDRWGGGFVVEVAKCAPEGITTYWGEFIPPNKVRAWDIGKRLRLGSKEENDDYWFRYDNDNEEFVSFENIFENTAKKVIPFIHKQAEDWWRN